MSQRSSSPASARSSASHMHGLVLGQPQRRLVRAHVDRELDVAVAEQLVVVVIEEPQDPPGVDARGQPHVGHARVLEVIEHAHLEVVGGRQPLDQPEVQIDEVIGAGLRLDHEQRVDRGARPSPRTPRRPRPRARSARRSRPAARRWASGTWAARPGRRRAGPRGPCRPIRPAESPRPWPDRPRSPSSRRAPSGPRRSLGPCARRWRARAARGRLSVASATRYQLTGPSPAIRTASRRADR